MALQNPGRDYPVNFVEPPPKQTPVDCAICLDVLFHPKMVSCCGHSFCAACISRVERDHKPCPLCNQEFSLVGDKRLERTLNDLNVYCPHREKGCEWNGELRELPRHLNQDPKADELLVGCLFQEIRCGLCQAHSCERRLMNDHIFAQCPNRDIECEYRFAGCDVKKPQGQLESHGKEAFSSHLSLVANLVQGSLSQKDIEIQELKEELSHQRMQMQELKQEHTELKQQHTDLQGRTNRHWILVLLLLIFAILLSGGMVYAYLYQTDLPIDLNKLNISMTEANVTFSSMLESLGQLPREQFTNSCINLTSKIQELNSSIQQVAMPEVNQDSKNIGDVRQESSDVLENNINVMDLGRPKSAYKISTLQMSNLSDLCNKVQELNDSIQQMEMKQDSIISNKLQEVFSSLPKERKANEKMREQILNEIQALSKDVEKYVMDIKRLESAYTISTNQINESLKNLEKQVVDSNNESGRHECNSSSLNTMVKEFQHLAYEVYYLGQHVDFPVLPVYLNMTNVKERNASKSRWLSEPFYTHEEGYKMRLVVYPNGKYSGASTHISVAVYLMSGKYDHKLNWPVNMMLDITLLSQDSEDTDPIRTSFDFCTLPLKISSLQIFDRVWNGTMAKIGVINPNFASYGSIFLSHYKHNSLYFRVDGVRCTCQAEDEQSSDFVFDRHQVEPNLEGSRFSTYTGYDKTIHTSTVIYCGIHSCSQPFYL